MADGMETPPISRKGESSASVGNLSFDIEELDDKEFDIPPVETPPTLESILNESDRTSLSDDEFSNQLGLFHEVDDTTSIGSTDSRSCRSDKKNRKSPLYGIHGSILRHVILRGVSSQLQSAAERVNAGKPTAMAVSSVIAIGTFHGLVLVFDPNQVLKWCLGDTSYGEQYGSVSSLGFSNDCSRLLCGYSKGQITMWDLNAGKLLRTISDAHPPQTAVLHIKFTDDPTLALCSDSGGSVFELNFKRVMGTRTCETRCIFSGSRGEVCTFEPLRMIPYFRDHPSQEVCLVALGTVTKVIVVTVRPSLKVWFTRSLRADADTLPVLCWQFVIIQVAPSTRIIDPVLAFGRQNLLYFYQVNYGSAEKINFIPLQKMELNYVVQNFTWLNSRTLVTLDTSEHLHVVDARSEEELEILDIADVQLVYGISHFKGLATGGNVSKAMAVAGERACYHSMAAFGAQLLLLGLKSVHVMTLRTWKERIDFLSRQNMYPESLALALSFYEDQAKAVTGLSGKKPQRQEVVASVILDLLNNFVDLAMTQLCPEHGRIELLIHHYKETVPLCVDYCLAINKRDFLFDKIYERFQADPIAKGVFLESLEPYILDGRLSFIVPVIAKDLVTHFAERQLFQSLEACLVRLDIACLDIHQVMTLCWTHGLYDAIIYVYNRGMNDYITPLEELILVLQEAVRRGKQLRDDQIRLGNKLLVYVSCCLAGRAYPWGDIPQDTAATVMTEVFQCVTRLRGKRQDDETVYPYLKTLLHFDTREFLNVLALAFEEEEFNTQSGLSQKQRVVDILLQVMVESEGFSPTQVGALFTFLARQLAKQENSIMVNRMLFEQVLEYLTNPGDETRMEERQQALMDLLQAGGLAQVDENRLLTLVEKAKFFRVCEYLYEKYRQFDKILSCYLLDPSRKPQVFYFARQVLGSQDHVTDEKNSLENKIVNNIQELVDIDNKKTSHLLLDFFPHRLKNIIDQLKDRPTVLYHLLQGVFTNREVQCSPGPGPKEHLTVEPIVQETYIDLMCQFNPTHVHSYICNTEGYRLEETLEICRQYQIMGATAYLLEKAGDVHGAFSIILEDLQKKVRCVTDEILKDSSNMDLDISIPWTGLQSQMFVLIQLCQRNSNKMDQAERETLWFPLLESMMAPQRQLKGRVKANYLDAFKELTRHLLNSMIGYITLPAILQRIVQDPAYNTGKFGEIRKLIMGMFQTYNYEKTLLTTTTNLLNNDLHLQLSQLCLTANRGYTCHGNICSMCHKNYIPSNDMIDEIILFRCGHTYHINCLVGKVQNNQSTDEEFQHWMCYQCPHINKPQGVLTTQRIVENMSASPFSSPGIPTSRKITGRKDIILSPNQQQALENLHRRKTRSRLQMLEELSRGEHERLRSNSSQHIEDDELYKLNLTPAWQGSFSSEF